MKKCFPNTCSGVQSHYVVPWIIIFYNLRFTKALWMYLANGNPSYKYICISISLSWHVVVLKQSSLSYELWPLFPIFSKNLSGHEEILSYLETSEDWIELCGWETSYHAAMLAPIVIYFFAKSSSCAILIAYCFVDYNQD